MKFYKSKFAVYCALVGKEGEVEKYRKMLKKKLSDAMDYCPGSPLDRLHDYPITDMPRWRRKFGG